VPIWFVDVMSECPLRLLPISRTNSKEEAHASLWKLLLRRSKTGGVGGTGSDGLLSLRFLSLVVWRACKAFSLWKPEAVRITSGAEHVATFQKTELSQRQYCRKCGGHLMTNHPNFGLVDVFAATLPTLKFTPSVHVNYAETVLPMRDGVLKLGDFPKDLGGSREVIPE
jgi:hypothetical protein